MDLATSYADGMLCVTAQALNALVSPVAVRTSGGQRDTVYCKNAIGFD
jgi:hypothetical protein